MFIISTSGLSTAYLRGAKAEQFSETLHTSIREIALQVFLRSRQWNAVDPRVKLFQQPLIQRGLHLVSPDRPSTKLSAAISTTEKCYH